jgi:methyl-accepting chemotaxis protein
MFANFKIKTLVIGVLGFLIALMIIMGVMGVYGAQSSVALVKDVTVAEQKNTAAQTAIRLEMELGRSQVLQALQHNPAFAWAQLHDHPLTVHFDQIEAISVRANKGWTEYLAGLKSEEEKRLAQEWFAKSEGLGLGSVKAAAAFVKAGSWDEAEMVLIKKINPSYRVGDVALKALTDTSTKRIAADEVMVNSSLKTTAWTMMAMLAAGLAMSLVVGWALVHAVSDPLEEAMAIAKRVADGDLTGAIVNHSNNEIGALLDALDKMKENLAGIVGEVRTSTDTIASASGEIAAGNMDLSNRTGEQADSLEKTASSMEQLTSTVKQNADNARQANQLAMSASAVATRGGVVVSQVVDTMGSINESSKKIVDIIAVIDGIAFQTNILALNAAVEAARAGEQGRGFAVVASEVRNLAQRSASAAKEIKELIGDSVDKVDSGARLVDQAGVTMQEIVSSIQRVTDIMGEITQASQEQTSGLDQINQAIGQMDAITQQNVALVEEAAAASGALQDQASKLAGVVGVFKLDESVVRAAAPAIKIAARKPVVRKLDDRRHMNGANRLPAVAKQPPPKPKRVAAATANADWEEF